MRIRFQLQLLAAIAFLGACTSTTEVLPDREALDAAAQFNRFANEAGTSGADPDVISGYFGIASTLGLTARISPLTVVIDGTPLDFLASAEQEELTMSPGCIASGSCFATPPRVLRGVIAWQKSDPHHVVQLTATPGNTEIRPSAAGWLVGGTPQIAALTYFDGSGGVFVGSGGMLHISDPAAGDTQCGVGGDPMFLHCTHAEFTASLDGAVAPPSFVVRGNTAAGTHTIAIAAQPVHGAIVALDAFPLPCPGCLDRQNFFPPINLRGGDLRATTTASVTGSVVALELRVTNLQTVPVTAQFTSGQQFDFRVRRLATPAWFWSADKAFTGALGSRTFAPGETVVYTATWTPPDRGTFVVDGWLTSSSHAAGSTTEWLPFP